MRYLPLTGAEREEMKKVIGISDVSELFSCLPTGECRRAPDRLPPALSEPDLIAAFREIARKNTASGLLSFLGAGAYDHFIPEVVSYLSAKGEFLTPYTPYQPEVSQGSLQAIFEYQTMMAMLTGLDVANASLYDGATAAAEAVLLAVRRSGRRRVLLSSSLHPEYAAVVRTYAQNLDIELPTVAVDVASGRVDSSDLRAKLDDSAAAFVFQSPNFLGIVEDGRALGAIVHERKAYSAQVVAEAMALPFLVPPGENGIDIAVGEAQSFGLPLGFGGPYLGFMAAREEFMRQLPGRLVGQTRDLDGRRGYVLTLSTREQHIKREKATSNICSNQAWCALRAGMYLAVMGQAGLARAARSCHLNAAYFAKEAAGLPGVRVVYPRNFFNEVLLEVRRGSAADLARALQEKGILAGVPLSWFDPGKEDRLLLAFSETHNRAAVDRLLAAIGDAS
ncbi:MAG: aminomethyl-transferring glycine dehydrogenase subunit GcvPA [Candidatus Aminicenantes bacterium]|nr:aminomethyl-transferring glycine dehydrogenase subunit GcvPA [Candidatus Aminicenantes bacterium]